MRKLSTKISIVITLAIIVITSIFGFYLIESQAKQLNNMIVEKGNASASTGATIVSIILEKIIDNGIFSLEEVFNQDLVTMPVMQNYIENYKNISPEKLTAIQKYHYTTGFDSYLDNALIEIQDKFLKDTQIEYAILIDKNGYLPVHNSKYNEFLTNDYKYDLTHNRTKRIFRDTVSYKISENKTNPHLKSIYHRDTGEVLWDISAPVFVKGRHWGGFRIGLSMEKAALAISDLRKKLIIAIIILVLIISLIVNRLSAYLMRPLVYLHDGVEHLSQGNLNQSIDIKSNDEIGDLAIAFNDMVDDLKKHINELQKTTADKQKIESELQVAHAIQDDMLPKIFPPYPDKINHFDIRAHIDPAKEVGGDFYDYQLIGDNFFFTIGDVSGKGVPASLFMAITLTLLRATATKITSPAAILNMVNKELCHDNRSALFVTVFYGSFNLKTGVLEYSLAGHNPPYLVNNNGVSALPSTNGMALGVDEDFEYKSNKVKLNPQDSLFLFTDGVTEAQAPGGNDFYTDQRLISVLENCKEDYPQMMLDRVLADLKSFIKDAPKADDITILTFKYLDK